MQVMLIKHVHSCFATVSSKDAFLLYDFYLPFSPSVGMQVQIGERMETVVNVVYKISKGQVLLYVEEDKTIYNADLKGVAHKARDKLFRTLMEHYLSLGWRKRERYE